MSLLRSGDTCTDEQASHHQPYAWPPNAPDESMPNAQALA
jgi:hypothetical protein